MTADARVLTNYMRMECLNNKYIYDSPLNVGTLVAAIGDKSQRQTAKAGKRPYGVGLIVASVDEGAARIYETSPSGNFFEYHAYAIGQRSQSAKTYLEKNFESLAGLSEDELVQHAVKALAVATEQNVELTERNIDVAVVSAAGYKLLTDAALAPFVESAKRDAPAGGPAPMDTD